MAQSRQPALESIWAWSNTVGSVGAPLLWGIALASLLDGVPIDSDQGWAGDFGDLFSGYTVLAGIASAWSSRSRAVYLTPGLSATSELGQAGRPGASRRRQAVGAGFLVDGSSRTTRTTRASSPASFRS